MKDYSQNGEQQIILEYFGDFVGNFCDIGANDGITLSNTYALALKGWYGTCFEPSPKAFALLKKNYKDNPRVEPLPYAVGTEFGPITLHESDSHIVNGSNNNIALLSTTKTKEIERWGKTQYFFPVRVDGIAWKGSFYEDMHIDMLNIDAEGMDWEILQQINLSKVKLVCIEWNGIPDLEEKFTAYCSKFGLSLRAKNGENMIFVR